MKRAANRRKNQQRDGIQNKDCAERHAHFVVVGMKDWTDRCDGAAAADCRSGGNQKRGIAANLEDFPESETSQERKRNSQRGVDEAAAAGFQHFVQIHSEAERDHAYLEEDSSGGPCGGGVRMRETETEQNADGESQGRRKKPCERKDECEKKQNFREQEHRPSKEYQAGYDK